MSSADGQGRTFFIIASNNYPLTTAFLFCYPVLTSLRQTVKTHRRNDALSYMPDIWNSKIQPKVERVKLTARVSLEAYDSITELQRRHRGQTGRALPLWKIVDAAIKAYARNNENGS